MFILYILWRSMKSCTRWSQALHNFNWKTFIKYYALKMEFYVFMQCSIQFSLMHRLVLLSAFCCNFVEKLTQRRHTHTFTKWWCTHYQKNILYFSSREHNTLVLNVVVSVTLCSHTDNYMHKVSQRVLHPTFIVILFTDNYAQYCLVLHGRMHKITIDTYTF